MVKAIDLYRTMKHYFRKGSDAKIKIKIAGDRKRYDINEFCTGYMVEYGNVIIVGKECNDKPVLTVDTLAQLLSEHRVYWNENTTLLYNNGVRCNLITEIKISRTSLTLEVDVFKNNAHTD